MKRMKMLPVSEDEHGNLIYEGDIEPIAVRTSERESFKKCHRLWDYTSQNRRNLEPVRQSLNLVFGISVHKGLEAYYSPHTWGLLNDAMRIDQAVGAFLQDLDAARRSEGGNLSPEREAEYEELTTLGTEMLRNYGKWAPERDKALGLKPIAVEEKFQVPIYSASGSPLVVDGKPVVYQVRIDLIAEHDNSIWIWDHKTASNISSDTLFLDIDTQVSSYAWAYMIKYGKRVSGILYNELAKTYPSPPRVLKNGSLSQDKRQSTTYELYAETIDKLGLDPAPYSAMLDFLSQKPDNYFRRTPLLRSTKELAQQGKYVVEEIYDMVINPSLYPSPSKINCGNCGFKYPCLVANECGDVDFALGDTTLFRTRTS